MSDAATEMDQQGQTLKRELDALLEERHLHFPIKSDANSRALAQQLTGYMAHLKLQLTDSFTPAPLLLEQAAAVIDRPIFICGHAKSGTTLLVNLLDAHPQLVTMPSDSHAIHVAQTYASTTTASTIMSHRDLEPWLFYWLGRMINPSGQKPFWLLGKDDHAYIELLHNLLFWRQELAAREAAPFLAAVLAYFCANSRRPRAPIAWVAKTPANEYRIEMLLKQYPTARFIHVLRNPMTNLVSMKRLSTFRSGKAYTLRSAYRIRRSLSQGARNQKYLGEERYQFVYYKDMVTAPQATMAQIARYLGIEFHHTLLSPTVNGLTATANSMRREHAHRGEVHNNDVKLRDELNLAERLIAQLIFWNWQRPFQTLDT